MNMDEVLPTFIAESEEGLRDLESGLLACSQGHADAETIKKACNKGFPKPKQTFGKLTRGDAYVPEGFEKRGTL